MLLAEIQKLADGNSRAKHAGRSGNVPADIVMVRIDGIADSAFGFHAQHEGVEEILSRHGLHYRQRDDCRSDRPCRMDNGFQVRVVAINDVAGYAVDRRSIHETFFRDAL